MINSTKALCAGITVPPVSDISRRHLRGIERGRRFHCITSTYKAISAVPKCADESLLQPRNKDQSAAVLTFHMVQGKIMITDIVGQSTEVKSARGSVLPVDAIDCARVDSASVVHADIGGITE